jgi:hypothetical protein
MKSIYTEISPLLSTRIRIVMAMFPSLLPHVITYLRNFNDRQKGVTGSFARNSRMKLRKRWRKIRQCLDRVSLRGTEFDKFPECIRDMFYLR